MLFAAGISRICNGLDQVFEPHNCRVHRLGEIFITIAKQNRSSHVLGDTPQSDVRLWVDYLYSELTKHR